MELKPLNPKEKAFVEAYMANNFNAAKAYRISFETDSLTVSKSEGYRLLTKPNIKVAIEAAEGDFAHLARQMKLGREELVKSLQELVYGNNDRVKLEAIKTVCKLCGDFSEKQEITIAQESEFDSIDISKLTPEEQEALRMKIINSMI